ncbi:MAG: TIGR04282 family arsenosugar biosynthesis glycosyltransferase [Cyanobium sp.]
MARPRRRLVVLARWPAAGRCKRRLAAGCGSADAAAAVQRTLSVHTLAAAGVGAARAGAELWLAVDGLGERARRRWGEQLAAPITVAQGGGSLGTRLQRQWRRAFGAGCAQVVLIGSDLPHLEAGDLTAAFAALEHRPLVLGPAADGGYWLIGLSREGFRRAGAQLVAGVPWGGPQVLAHSLAAAAGLGLETELLRRQADLDQRSDLAPWQGGFRRAERLTHRPSGTA